MLVSVRKVIHLLLILVLIRGLNMAAGGCNTASNGKALVDNSISQKGSRKFQLRGRKMAFDGLMRLDKMSEIGLLEETGITSSRASIKEKKKVMSFNVVKGQQSKRSLLSKKKELAGFGAFTADYKGPMHHPPKNN